MPEHTAEWGIDDMQAAHVAAELLAGLEDIPSLEQPDEIGYGSVEHEWTTDIAQMRQLLSHAKEGQLTVTFEVEEANDDDA